MEKISMAGVNWQAWCSSKDVLGRCAFALLMPFAWLACSNAQELSLGSAEAIQQEAFVSDQQGLQMSRELSFTSQPALNTQTPPSSQSDAQQPESPHNISKPLQTGLASWYGGKFHGRRTASGEVFNAKALTAAHPSLPMNSWLRVINRSNGKQVVVRVNDRGPYHGQSRRSRYSSRILDVSEYAAELLGFKANGTATVDIHPLGNR